MKEVRDAIDVIKGGREKVDEASNWKDRAWGIKYFRTRGKAMLKLDDQVAELEKSYAELQKQVEQHKKAFDEEEKKHQARDDAHTPENLKMAKDFLDANRAKGEAQRKAGRDSVARQNQLKELIKQGKLAAATAQKDLDELGKDPLSKYQYNAEGHEHLKEHAPKLARHIEELKPQIKEMKIDLKKQEQLVTGAEIEIDKKKLDITNAETRYEEAKVTVSKSVGTIVHNASLLQKRGVEVPQPPANVLPHLPRMPLFQPQQPQAQPQAGPR
jgi:chromosome segregation ATPase